MAFKFSNASGFLVQQMTLNCGACHLCEIMASNIKPSESIFFMFQFEEFHAHLFVFPLSPLKTHSGRCLKCVVLLKSFHDHLYFDPNKNKYQTHEHIKVFTSAHRLHKAFENTPPPVLNTLVIYHYVNSTLGSSLHRNCTGEMSPIHQHGCLSTNIDSYTV